MAALPGALPSSSPSRIHGGGRRPRSAPAPAPSPAASPSSRRSIAPALRPPAGRPGGEAEVPVRRAAALARLARGRAGGIPLRAEALARGSPPLTAAPLRAGTWRGRPPEVLQRFLPRLLRLDARGVAAGSGRHGVEAIGPIRAGLRPQTQPVFAFPGHLPPCAPRRAARAGRPPWPRPCSPCRGNRATPRRWRTCGPGRRRLRQARRRSGSPPVLREAAARGGPPAALADRDAETPDPELPAPPSRLP